MMIRILLLMSIGIFFLSGCAATSDRTAHPASLGSPSSATAAPSADVSDATDATDVSDTAFNAEFDRFADLEGPEKLIADPFEPINRGVFWVNDKLYFYLFKPVAKGYRVIVPRPARVSVSNFFMNISTPVRAGNALLQLKFSNFGTETYRFFVNSTIGIVGLFDPAASIAGVRRAHGDFGQTLGAYGFGHGFYLVLPVVGPSSLRDGTGSFVDSFADPFRYVGLATEDLLMIRLFDSTNRLSLDRDTYEGIVRDALDPYLFIRTAYAQRRLAQVGETVYNMNIMSAPVFDNDFFNPLEWFRFQQ